MEGLPPMLKPDLAREAMRNAEYPVLLGTGTGLGTAPAEMGLTDGIVCS